MAKYFHFPSMSLDQSSCSWDETDGNSGPPFSSAFCSDTGETGWPWRGETDRLRGPSPVSWPHTGAGGRGALGTEPRPAAGGGSSRPSSPVRQDLLSTTHSLSAGTHLMERCPHAWEGPEINETRTQSHAEQMPGWGGPEDKPIPGTQATTGAWLCLSGPVRLSTQTRPPNKCCACSTTFCLYVETHVCAADGPGPRPGRWPDGLVAAIQRPAAVDIGLWLGTETLLRAMVGQGCRGQAQPHGGWVNTHIHSEPRAAASAQSHRNRSRTSSSENWQGQTALGVSLPGRTSSWVTWVFYIKWANCKNK